MQLLEPQPTTLPIADGAEPDHPRGRFGGRRVLLLVLAIALAGAGATLAPRLVGSSPSTSVSVASGEALPRLVRSHDGRTFSSTIDGDVTRVEQVSPDARPIASIGGRLELRLADRDGGRLVLADPLPAGGDLYRPGPRTSTELVVVDTATGTTTRHTLGRNVEPEAFGIDNSLLFLIEHRPAVNPDHYRVVSLDVVSGDFGELLGPNKRPLGFDMTGTARQQVPSASGEQLYTLYVQHGHDASHETRDPTSLSTGAFVHVLDLRGAWAFCVDLAGFGHGPPESAAIALGAGGDRLFVADARAGRLATIDTNQLSVETLANGQPTVGAVALPGGVAADDSLRLRVEGSDLVLEAAAQSWVYDTVARTWR